VHEVRRKQKEIMEKQVILKPFHHRGQESIGLIYVNDKSLNGIVRRLKKAKWSQTKRCWYVPLNQEAYKEIITTLQRKALLDNTELKSYLEKKKAVTKTLPVVVKKTVSKSVVSAVAWKLSPDNLLALEKFVEQLKLKAYSNSTITTYRNEFIQLLRLLKAKPVNELTTDDLRRYMVYAMEKEGIKENTAHSRLNALKFYFEQVLGREKFFGEIPRPKRPVLLPKLLNESEIARLFNALINKKHKAILFTAYSAGLRVSEVVNLKLSDIDSHRMQILIREAKGKKDRYVNLSPVLLDILRSYIKGCNPQPKVYLFESEQTGTAYPTRTIQQLFSLAKNKAGIRKQVGIHSLRHSFATHLLDKGTDIKYIKDLLGHFNIKTTERYLHVSKKQLVNISSPFDDLWKKTTIDW
jgi:integrase/recombinase XerD